MAPSGDQEVVADREDVLIPGWLDQLIPPPENRACFCLFVHQCTKICFQLCEFFPSSTHLILSMLLFKLRFRVITPGLLSLHCSLKKTHANKEACLCSCATVEIQELSPVFHLLSAEVKMSGSSTVQQVFFFFYFFSFLQVW